MAIKINDTTIIDDSANANLSHVSISSLGTVTVGTYMPATPPHAGTLFGYTSGGVFPTRPSAPPIFMAYVDKFPFAADVNATSVANIQTQRRRMHVASSEVAGYSMGGDALAPTGISPFQGLGYYFQIEKFNFVTEDASTGVGSLQAPRINSGAGCASPTHGYAGAGSVYNNAQVQIERFPFASESETAVAGGLTYYRTGHMEAASMTHGYHMNGLINSNAPPNTTSSIMEKYQFAADTQGAVIGESTLSRWLGSGLSSPTHAYTAGGVSNTPTVRYTTIDKVSFAAEGNATLVGNLTSNNGSMTATTSATNGYVLGGATSNNPPAPTTGTDAIDKFPFATDANATDVADLTEVKYQAAGFMN